MNKKYEKISGEISTLSSDLVPVYEATPQYMQDQHQFDTLSGNLAQAQTDLSHDKAKKAKTEIGTALQAYQQLDSSVNFTDSCDTDVGILETDVKQI